MHLSTVGVQGTFEFHASQQRNGMVGRRGVAGRGLKGERRGRQWAGVGEKEGERVRWKEVKNNCKEKEGKKKIKKREGMEGESLCAHSGAASA